MKPQQTTFATIPMQVVGPIKITGPEVDDEVMAPLATYETPLWASVNRGAKASLLAGGIKAVVVDDRGAADAFGNHAAEDLADWRFRRKADRRPRLEDLDPVVEQRPLDGGGRLGKT